MGSGTLANFLLDERVASIVAVILTATLSYVFTKRSENKKHNVEIYMQQLEKVFLPLYLLVFDKNIEDIDFQNLLQNMKTKKRKYFLYLSCDFLKIIMELEKEITQGNITRNTKRLCKKYIEFEYLRLKRILGFPHKIEEYFGSYFRYIVFRNVIYFAQIALLFSITFLSIFGSELYHNYSNAYQILCNLIGILFLFNILLLFAAIMYYLYWFFYLRKNKLIN
ncbi:hypothetical protein SAMN05660368_01025 [Marvinbryantia formatexigens]|nr:hypothetical protein SAMN05660368_01025 [Marvinbryantia formatexigens]